MCTVRCLNRDFLTVYSAHKAGRHWKGSECHKTEDICYCYNTEEFIWLDALISSNIRPTCKHDLVLEHQIIKEGINHHTTYINQTKRSRVTNAVNNPLIDSPTQ